MKKVRAVDIHNNVDAVKDTTKPFLKEGKRIYISIEDVREEVFNLKKMLKQSVEAGRQCVGWCAVDTQYMNRKLDEIFQLTYEKLEE